jgi:hypothetical protein
MGKKKGFVEKNQNIIIVLIIIAFALFVFYNADLTAQSITNTTTNNNNDSQITTPTTQPQSNVDLRTIFLPYFAIYPDAQTTCEAYGGTWYYQQNMVGCLGAGPASCSEPIAYAMMTQCVGAGGNFVCVPCENAYCEIM